ncbi:MAG: LysM peptidoglycan-binding domain-containing protein [Burkholderiaceae bacterium]|nr:LysM peptidoglycan-binding domain-containing protein [Burkholderiaceae bacterium]
MKHLSTLTAHAAVPVLAWLVLGTATTAQAQTYPVTQAQRETAQQVAQDGVPLSELAANAPDQYSVKAGDTLWAISGIFLKSPWRWPELWGMNLQDIRNPHLIFPGQVLYLEKLDGRARLKTRRDGGKEGEDVVIESVKISPRTRIESLRDTAVPTLKSHLIEPFLAEPLVVGELTLNQSPRIVGTQEDRVLLSRGDRAYALGGEGQPLRTGAGQARDFRVFREARPMIDPVSKEVLGYEAQYVGQAQLARGESLRTDVDANGKGVATLVPATIDIISVKEELRVGDRLLPEPPRQLRSYTPRAPVVNVDARIMSIYGSAVRYATQNQVVAINKGSANGLEIGDVLAILKSGQVIVDKTTDARPALQLPDERVGLLMVFRTFERVSYGLILEVEDGVQVGDRLVNPR